MEPVIRTEQLTKVYPNGVRAVENLDLELNRGEIFGFLGPNGAGKTTTVGMLTTRVIPTSGRAFVDGVDVVEHPTAAKQVIGVVPQTNTLDRSLDVWENLYFHGRFFSMSAATAKSEATRLVEQFRLGDRAHERIDNLSGGMAQRLMVARAIMHRPATLFLDEPTAGLDPHGRNEVWESIRSLAASGTTVLLTTQYLEEADQLADAISVIVAGRVVAAGYPDELKSLAGGDRIDVVLRDVGDLIPAARLLQVQLGAEVSLDHDTRGLSVPVTDRLAALAHVIRSLHDENITAEDITVRRPTLDEAFLHLTGQQR
jgi:ABC-2 type transport system ATP-binding protein